MNTLKFVVEVDREDLMDWVDGMKVEQIANMLRNSLEKGGFCYSAKVRTAEGETKS